jgi:hypothetical protein
MRDDFKSWLSFRGIQGDNRDLTVMNLAKYVCMGTNTQYVSPRPGVLVLIRWTGEVLPDRQLNLVI